MYWKHNANGQLNSLILYDAVVLTGDYHFSDLKILSSANINSSTAAEAYNTQHFKRPIYQVCLALSHTVM